MKRWLVRECPEHGLHRAPGRMMCEECFGPLSEEFEVVRAGALTLNVSAAPDENQLGRSHRDDPPTSLAAARQNEMRTGSQKFACFERIATLSDLGATWDELEVDLQMYSAQKRVSELKLDGWIEPSGEHRPTRRGAPAEVYVLSDKGREWLQTRAVAA